MLDMNIGDRLKKLREDAGLDQVQAAKLAETTKQAVSQIENGRTKVPGGLYLFKWAKHYKVDLEWLITGGGTPHPLVQAPASQPERLTADIIRSAIILAKKSFRLASDEELVIERDPEVFAQALRTALAAKQRREKEGGTESGSGDGQVGTTRRAKGAAKDGEADQASTGRRRKQAGG